MDLFTHMMVSYLLGQGYNAAGGSLTEPQLLFAVIAGIFPDFDILTLPLWKRFPRLRHHGITHSLLFPVVNAFVLSFVVYLVWHLDPLQFIPVGIFMGAFHVLSDLATNFPVPILAPASWKGFSLAVDSAVNPYTMFPNLVLMAFFWNLRAGGFDLATFRLMLLAVALWLVAHFGVKLALKLYIRRTFRGEAERVDAHPTFGYLGWYIVLSRTVGAGRVTEYQRHRIGRSGRRTLFYEAELPAGGARGPAPPVDTKEKALLASYAVVSGKALALGEGDEVAAVISERKEGGWEAFWFRWWNVYRPPVKGLLVTVLPDGTCDVAGASRKVEF